MSLCSDIYSPYVPLNVGDNNMLFKLKRRTLSSISHATDCVGFLEILLRLETGKDTEQNITDFLTKMKRDISKYEKEFKELENNGGCFIDQPVVDFGSSTEIVFNFETNYNVKSLTENPLK